MESPVVVPATDGSLDRVQPNGGGPPIPDARPLAQIDQEFRMADAELAELDRRRASHWTILAPALILLAVIVPIVLFNYQGVFDLYEAFVPDPCFGIQDHQDFDECFRPWIPGFNRFRVGMMFGIWLVTLLTTGSYYHFRYRLPIQRATARKEALETELQYKRMEQPGGKRRYYDERLRRLTHRAVAVFWDDEAASKQVAEFSKQAGSLLQNAELSDFTEVQYFVSSIDERIAREERDVRERRAWQRLVIAIIVFYVGLLLAAGLFIDVDRSNDPIPVFGVPLSVLMWGAAGSLAAILYRFYTEQDRIRVSREIGWLIARPIIGIIMGAVVYVALVSGLILFGASPATAETASEAPVPTGRLEVYWIVAFLAGFSDKFYIGIIDLLVERTVPGDRQEPAATNGRGRRREETAVVAVTTTESEEPRDPAAASPSATARGDQGLS